MHKLMQTTAFVIATAVLTPAVSANTLYFQLNPNNSNDGVRQVFLFGAPNSTGTVFGAGGFEQTFDLGAAGFSVVNVRNADELANGTIEAKGYRVVSDANLSGYYLSRVPFTTDITYLIDGDRLGTDHVVTGFASSDQMSVQATIDNTVVTFAPKGAAAFDVTLNAGQTYMFAGNNLTGSRITSTSPVTVFSGNRCTNVPLGVSACDHLVEQVPSVNLLSSSYLVAQTPRTGTQGNVLRVVATEADTEVRINGALVATLAAGDFYEGRVVGGQQIDATKKVLVAQYLIGQSQAGANTDPAMAIIPGSDQWLKSYVFATPSGTADFPADFVSIIIGNSDIDSLTVAGVAADPSLFTALGTTAFSFGSIDVSATVGPFAISADNPFQLLLSGFGNFDSYFTFGGAAFSPGASPPPPPTSTRWYWDGDGVTSADNGIVDGGDGVLTATRPNFTTESGATNGAYAPQPGNIVFIGAPGVVTVDDVDGAVAVSGMRFGVDGYRVTGDAITLSGNARIEVGDGSDAGAAFRARIESALTGSGGLTKADRGLLVLVGPNDYAGGTIVEAGTLVGNSSAFGTGAIENNATLVFNQSAAGSFANGIGGTGTLIKTGAAVLNLGGTNGLLGATSVEAGRLNINGILASSAVTVRSGATLGGNGTAGATSALTGSFVAPGLSIGTLNVAGDYAQASGATYDVELTAAPVASDRIAVTGSAAIAAGAVLRVAKLDAARYTLGSRYTVLTTGVQRTGTFTLAGPTRVSRFVDIVANYDQRNAYLDVLQTSRFATAGQTPNQIGAATGSDNFGNGALFQAIAFLQTDAEARGAFDQISGELHASVQNVAFEDSRFIREAVANHLLSPYDTRRGLWMHGYGSWGTTDGDGNAANFKRDIGGFFLGADVVNSDAFTLGIVGGYSKADVRLAARNSLASTDDIHIGGYGDFNIAGFGGRVGITHSWRDVGTRRSVAFGGFADTLAADYKIKTFQAFADVGYRIERGAIGIEPFGALAYVRNDTEAFRETGGSAALRGGKRDENFWITNLGARLSYGLPVGGGRYGITASASWRHAFIDDGAGNSVTGLRFAAGDGFLVYGPPLARDVAALGLKVAARIGATGELDFGYSGQVGDGLKDHGIKASFRLGF